MRDGNPQMLSKVETHLTAREVKEIEEICRMHKVTVSEFVRRLIRLWLVEYRKDQVTGEES